MNPLAIWTNLRSTVDSYVGVVGRRFLTLIWIIAICAAIWIFGPRLKAFGHAPLEPETNRVIAIVVVLLIWALWTLIAWWRGRSADQALVDDVTLTPEQQASAETKAEIAELRERLRSAMKMMRKVVKRRHGAAYEFPWYLMMGAPGAGKTTLLQNSGLKFPLGDALGAEPVKGVGGTRNCNWWFTDQAIMIDTAGRYTTQESGHKKDREGFLSFLAMLRKRRRAQPINGVVLTLSLTDLLSQPPEDRLRDVRAIRQRLSEIEDSLKARIPVYLVLTKADRLTGFSQFFETLGADGREQVWGMTFNLSEASKPGALPQLFSREYQALQDRLNGHLLERLQQEPDIDRRGRIFRFPAQIAALHDSLREMVEELSSGTAHISEPLIRGVYFASATQEPTADALRTARSMNQSFFAARLFREVILGEAALVARDSRLGKRKRLFTWLAYGATATAALTLLGAWFGNFRINTAALSQTTSDITRYEELANNIPVREVQDTDFLRVLPALNQMSQVPNAYAPEAVSEASFGLPVHRVSFGLDQSAAISAEYQSSYAQALGAYLLPRYMVALQNKLKEPELSEAEAFETLKHYLSLAGLGPIDQDALLAQADQVFTAQYPGTGRAQTRADLRAHMVAMLERGELPILEIDDALVEATRARIRDRSPGERVYDLLKTRETAVSYGQWTPAQSLGTIGSKVFERASGASLKEGINLFYTREGYQQVVLPKITAMAEIAASENWVRGPGAAQTISTSEIAEDAVQLYWADSTRLWRALVSDIVVRQPADLEDMSGMIAILSSDAAPLQRLAKDVAQLSHLTDGIENAALSLAAPELPFDPLSAPQPFGGLRRALEASGGEENATALDALTPILDQIYQQLNRVTATDARAAEIFGADSQLVTATQELVASGRKLPNPADAWVLGIAGQVSAASVEQARASMSALWAANGARECQRAVAGRYPFVPGAPGEVTIDDFTRIFGPHGLFDAFFTKNLEGFVDQSQTPWAWKGGLGTAGQSSPALAQFQHAAAIRTAFFPNNQNTPQVEVRFDLLSLNEGATVALIEIDDQTSVHGVDRAERRALVWPATKDETARITVLPGRRTQALQTVGPWAPFRLFDDAQTTPVSENQFDATFTVDGRSARFRVTSGSVNNPFRLDAIANFTCPDRL